MERRVEGRRHLSSWDTNPTLRAEAGLISFLIHLANGYSFLYKMTCPVHSLDSRSPGLKLPCHRSPNTLASAYTSVTGTFNSPKCWRWERWQLGGNQGWFLLWSSGCCEGGCQLRRDPCAHFSSLRHLQLGQLGTLKSAMAGLYTMENGKSYKWVVSFVCFFLRVSYYQLVTGDHVSVSELLALRKNLLTLWRRNSTASCTNRYLLLCERNTYTSYSASSFQSF